MSQDYLDTIILNNGDKRKIKRWQTMSGEVEHCIDLQSGNGYSEYDFSDIRKSMEKDFNPSAQRMYSRFEAFEKIMDLWNKNFEDKISSKDVRLKTEDILKRCNEKIRSEVLQNLRTIKRSKLYS